MTDSAETLPDDRDDDLPSDVASEAAGTSAEDSEAVPSDSAAAPAPPVDEEGLPEWEPLTPELVEDEAIRGDFMLRGAVILLALLMGWTLVQDSQVLTHIRSGEALVANGLFPSGRDTLAATTGQTRWVHLAWMFDAALAGVYGLLGEFGLTLLTSITAAVIFYLLSRISLPGVPSWWGSVCASLALVACFPSLTAMPQIITLLGMAVLLLLLHRRSVAADSGFAWPIVVTILVWCQFDDRAWIGTAALLAYSLGHQWDLRRGGVERSACDGSLLTTAAASLLVMLLHPFMWETWLSPVRLYQYEYPAQQTYAIRDASDFFRHFPLWSAEFWTLNYFNGAGLLLWVVTLVVLVLNAARVRTAHLALFVTTTLIAAAGGTELAVASIVFAALATVNAQQWYAASFRQTYSVETGELIFSRGGRALTVLALFALGFMMVAGHLTGAAGRRVGTGFSPDLQQAIDSYAAVLENSFDDRPFPFRPTQGDVLNWVGKRPFVDSRLRLFAAASPSIVAEHLQARSALRTPLDGSPPERQAWQSILDKYEITQAVPRLSGAAPDYITFYDLLSSPDWTLMELGSDTALFCRTDLSDPQLAAHIAERGRSDLVQTQLRVGEADVISEMRTLWPSAPSVYSRYFYQPSPTASRPLQRARHYLALSEGVGSPDQAVAALYAAIRDVHRGLVDHPADATAYQVLARSYATLWSFERGLMEAQQLNYPGALRYAQTVSAYHQAIICDPTDPLPHLRLFGLYTQQQRHDLAQRHLQEFERIAGRLTTLPESDPQYPAEQEQMKQHLEQLTMQVNERRLQMDEDLAAGMDPAALAGTLTQSGYPLAALEVIEADLTQLSGNQELAYLYARLLLECGRTRDAHDQFQGLQAVADPGQLPDWALYQAISSLVAEDHYAALETLRTDYLALSTSAAMAMLYQHPLQAATRVDVTQPIDPMIPVARRLQLATVYFEQLLPRMEANALNQALIRLELGMNAEAANLLQTILQRDPLSALRPVAETYLQLLSEKPEIPPVPDVESLTAPIPDLFAAEADDQPDQTPAAEPVPPPDPASPDPASSDDSVSPSPEAPADVGPDRNDTRSSQ